MGHLYHGELFNHQMVYSGDLLRFSMSAARWSRVCGAVRSRTPQVSPGESHSSLDDPDVGTILGTLLELMGMTRNFVGSNLAFDHIFLMIG